MPGQTTEKKTLKFTEEIAAMIDLDRLHRDLILAGIPNKVFVTDDKLHVIDLRESTEEQHLLATKMGRMAIERADRNGSEPKKKIRMGAETQNDTEPVTVLPRETDYRYIGFQFGIGFCAAAAIAILAFAFCVIISSPILFPFLNGFFRGLGW